MNILESAWKTVEMTPFPITARPPTDEAVAAHLGSSQGLPAPQISTHDGSQYPYQSTAEHMPMKHFIHEVLRRSRTSFIALQTALCYIEAIRPKIPEVAEQEAAGCGPREVDQNDRVVLAADIGYVEEDVAEVAPPIDRETPATPLELW